VFIRFVVGSDGDHHRALTGIITEARLLRDRGELDQAEEARLEASYDWFEDHLPVPPFGVSNWSRDAVAWFKHDAGEPIRRMWDIVSLLRDHDVQVRLLKSVNPGRVVYEDGVEPPLAPQGHGARTRCALPGAQHGTHRTPSGRSGAAPNVRSGCSVA
jgi:hypothetical protein